VHGADAGQRGGELVEHRGPALGEASDAVAVELRVEEGERPGSPLALPANGQRGEGRL